VRVIASTNRDLEAEVTAGRFRADLFYRLNALLITVPPLRERPEDIPLLIEYFLAKYSRLMNIPRVQFSRETLPYLQAYAWPGNVRQLSNLVIRMMALGGNPIIEAADLPEEFTQTLMAATPATNGFLEPPKLEILTTLIRPEVTLAEGINLLERIKVYEALAYHKGNYAKAARQLGLSTFGLRKKYRRLFSNQTDRATEVSDKQPE
jgi:DNA-binding NtrC family response regulator